MWSTVPELRFVNGYWNQDVFIESIASSINEFWSHNTKGQKLIVSYHGLPAKGCHVPYKELCMLTTERLKKSLGLKDDEIEMVFQSRFGPTEWLQPYFETRLQELSEAGIQTIDVISPGFAVDCLETLHEICVEYTESFKKFSYNNEVSTLRYIPCLNDSALGVKVLERICTDNLW